MKGLIQRVSHASVRVDGSEVGSIQRGLLLFLGLEHGDSQETVLRMLDKILRYRVFPDENDRMNLSLMDVEGELLVVSQFTLAADTKKGLRPSFSSAASPEIGEALYDHFVMEAKSRMPGKVATGSFGADMKVELLNDGPVTFLMEF